MQQYHYVIGYFYCIRVVLANVKTSLGNVAKP